MISRKITPFSFLFILMLLISSMAFSQVEDNNAYPEVHLDEWQEMNQSKSKQKTMDWFQEAKFGMFIHWGIYSIPGGVWEGKKMEEMNRPWVAGWVL